MFYSKTTGIETWLTSDGRAYLVELDTGEEEPRRDSLSNVSQASEQVSVLCGDPRLRPDCSLSLRTEGGRKTATARTWRHTGKVLAYTT